MHDKAGDNIDIMSVQMANTQASALIYADSGDMLSPQYPLQGETIRVSRGISGFQQGTVTNATDAWDSEFCTGVEMVGADSSLTGVPGDSGSPIFRRWFFDGTWFVTPLGILNTADGKFGFVKDACTFWGATIFGA